MNRILTVRLKIEYPEKPIAWQRAGHSGHFYDPQLKAKENIREYVKNQYPHDLKPFLKAIGVNWYFDMPMPKSWSKKKRNELRGTLHDVRPDSSNLIKFCEDCFNNILWSDDCLIATGSFRKLWADEGKTRFEIIT